VPEYKYRFVTDTCKLTGVLEAIDPADLALKVLTGDDDGLPRWMRYGISDKITSFLLSYRHVELVDVISSNQVYSLSIALVGTRKRKPELVFDSWSKGMKGIT
jgi:hypothetical protein